MQPTLDDTQGGYTLGESSVQDVNPPEISPVAPNTQTASEQPDPAINWCPRAAGQLISTLKQNIIRKANMPSGTHHICVSYDTLGVRPRRAFAFPAVLNSSPHGSPANSTDQGGGTRLFEQTQRRPHSSVVLFFQNGHLGTELLSC